jgi:hypothetical protein
MHAGLSCGLKVAMREEKCGIMVDKIGSDQMVMMGPGCTTRMKRHLIG